jgi:hypothetical protein
MIVPVLRCLDVGCGTGNLMLAICMPSALTGQFELIA